MSAMIQQQIGRTYKQAFSLILDPITLFSLQCIRKVGTKDALNLLENNARI